MKIFDLSKPIHEEMIVYKNRDSKRIKRTIVANHEAQNYHESRLDMDMHCGTHMDAPLHMLYNGNTIDQLDLKRFLGPCKVFDLTRVEEAIHVADLQTLDIGEGDRVIFKTKNSFDHAYNPKFVYLEVDAAEYLVAKKIQCLGMDAMSIERDKPDHPTHQLILGAEIGVLEDLQLAEIEPGEYFLSALPLAIRGAEASPVRAVLVRF